MAYADVRNGIGDAAAHVNVTVRHVTTGPARCIGTVDGGGDGDTRITCTPHRSYIRLSAKYADTVG